MENNQSTYTTAQMGDKFKELDIEALKAMAMRTTVNKQPLGYSKGRFERFMNKIGWYRQSEWYIIDSSKFMSWKTFLNEEPKIR